jgi:hypothetical protein
MKREQVSDSSPTQPLLSDFSHTDANTMAARDPFADTDSEGVDRRPLDHNGEPVVATWKGRIWDTFDLPKDERKLLFKVDAFILTFASVSPGSFLRIHDHVAHRDLSWATSSRTSIRPMSTML